MSKKISFPEISTEKIKEVFSAEPFLKRLTKSLNNIYSYREENSFAIAIDDKGKLIYSKVTYSSH